MRKNEILLTYDNAKKLRKYKKLKENVEVNKALLEEFCKYAKKISKI